MDFYALNEVAIDGNLSNFGSGQVAISITSNGYAVGIAGSSTSASLVISTNGELIKTLPSGDGQVSVSLQVSASGNNAISGIAHPEIATTAEADSKSGITGDSSLSLAINATGILTQQPTGGQASIELQGSASGNNAITDIANAEVDTTAEAECKAGVTSSSSLSLVINATGALVQAPSGGLASIRVRGSAYGKKSKLGIASTEVIATAGANLRKAVSDLGDIQIVISGTAPLRRMRMQFGYVGHSKFVVLARGNAAMRHLKRCQAQASIELSGSTAITASIPEQPATTHHSRYVVLPVESRLMIVPPEKEQRGAYAAYSYVR